MPVDVPEVTASEILVTLIYFLVYILWVRYLFLKIKE